MDLEYGLTPIDILLNDAPLDMITRIRTLINSCPDAIHHIFENGDNFPALCLATVGWGGTHS